MMSCIQQVVMHCCAAVFLFHIYVTSKVRLLKCIHYDEWKGIKVIVT